MMMGRHVKEMEEEEEEEDDDYMWKKRETLLSDL
jgi:hypothetical protein